MPVARHQTSDARCQMPDIRRQHLTFNIQHLYFDERSVTRNQQIKNLQ